MKEGDDPYCKCIIGTIDDGLVTPSAAYFDSLPRRRLLQFLPR
jgi:hypothetical protein